MEMKGHREGKLDIKPGESRNGSLLHLQDQAAEGKK